MIKNIFFSISPSISCLCTPDYRFGTRAGSYILPAGYLTSCNFWWMFLKFWPGLDFDKLRFPLRFFIRSWFIGFTHHNFLGHTTPEPNGRSFVQLIYLFLSVTWWSWSGQPSAMKTLHVSASVVVVFHAIIFYSSLHVIDASDNCSFSSCGS